MWQEDIDAVLDRARRGEDEAWTQLVHRYARTIYFVTREYRLCEADMADVAQTCWNQLVRHIDTVRTAAALGAWLRRTAARECARVVAARSRLVYPQDWDSLCLRHSVPPRSTEEAVLRVEDLEHLRLAFARLSPRCQQIVVAAADLGVLDTASVATMFGLAESSMSTLRRRCLAVLRRHLHKLAEAA
ncbi:MAG: RNA polymerase sigma factor [Sciscionella sp.]